MRKKIYGQSKEVICAVCGETATSKNKQAIPVCRHHIDEELDLQCVCGGWLDCKESKYGPFFVCMECGAIGYAKGLEMNDLPGIRIEDL